MSFTRKIVFENRTPHAITVEAPDGTRRTFPPSGTLARVAQKNVPCGAVDGIPCARSEYGAVEGLPPAPPRAGEFRPLADVLAEDNQPMMVYIVSGIVLARCAGREDVVAPDTGPSAIRSPNGQVEAVRWFLR